MTVYAYRARDASGRELAGTVDATDPSGAAAGLRERGLLVFDLNEDASSGESAGAALRFSGLGFGPSGAAVEVTLRQLGVMLRSGLTLLEGLRTIAEQTQSRSLKRVWVTIAERIQAGSTLQEAMEDHRCFGRLVTHLVQVGEQTGALDSVLVRAAEALERRRLLRMRLVNAMLYPSVVLLAAIGATVFMLTFAIPRIATYLSSTGHALPDMTRQLIDLSDFLRTQWPQILAGILVVSSLAWLIYRSGPGRLLVDRLALRIPLIGLILRISITAGLSHALATMVRSGVTIVESLRTAEGLHHNRFIQGVLARARTAVIQGDPLAPTLKAPAALMPMLASMVAVGEQSGTLDHVLHETAEFHEQRLAALIGLLATAVEIAVVLVVGVIVGYVYIAFMLALYQAAVP